MLKMRRTPEGRRRGGDAGFRRGGGDCWNRLSERPPVVDVESL
jgi:hypothetical protein